MSLCVALSGCGKKGAPSPPGPADQVIYPKTYPTQ
jgi:predicted small lipoprotein YifL